MLELAEIAVFDLLHEGFALEEIALEVGSELAGDDEKLIVDHFRERDGAARGDEVRTPLEHEADVPESEEGEDCGGRGESGARGAEELRDALQENGEAENEKRGERNEKAVAERRDACPVWIARDEKIKRHEGGEERSASSRLAPAEKNQSGNGEKKDGSPREQAVVGGKQYGQEGGRAPEPVTERNVARFERAAVDDIAGQKSGQHAEEND